MNMRPTTWALKSIPRAAKEYGSSLNFAAQMHGHRGFDRLELQLCHRKPTPVGSGKVELVPAAWWAASSMLHRLRNPYPGRRRNMGHPSTSPPKCMAIAVSTSSNHGFAAVNQPPLAWGRPDGPDVKRAQRGSVRRRPPHMHTRRQCSAALNTLHWLEGVGG